MCIPRAEFRLAITSPHNKSMPLNRRLCFFMGAEYFLGGLFSAGRCHIYAIILHINIAIHSSCPHYPHSYPHVCGAIRPFFAFLHIIHTAARLCITPAHLHNARPLHRNPLAESALTEGPPQLYVICGHAVQPQPLRSLFNENYRQNRHFSLTRRQEMMIK